MGKFSSFNAFQIGVILISSLFSRVSRKTCVRTCARSPARSKSSGHARSGGPRTAPVVVTVRAIVRQCRSGENHLTTFGDRARGAYLLFVDRRSSRRATPLRWMNSTIGTRTSLLSYAQRTHTADGPELACRITVAAWRRTTSLPLLLLLKKREHN